MGNLNLSLKDVPLMNEKPTVLPPGNYLVAVEFVNEKQTKAANGSYLAMKLKVVNGPHEGQSFWTNFNINNPNEKAAAIGKSQLKTLMYAAQLENYEFLNDANDLLGLRFVATTAVESDNYGEKTVIKEYHKANTAGSVADDRPTPF